MNGPAQHLTSAEEFFTYDDQKHSELVRGVLRVCEPPGGVHGRLATRIAARLHGYVEQHQLGTVLVEAGYVVRRNPDTVRGPDVSFVSGTRILPERMPWQFIPGAPDLAVEILSPTNRRPEVDEKVAEYFGAGARMVWIVDPEQRRVIVCVPDRAAVIVAENDPLDGGEVIPGLRYTVAEVFGN